MKVSRKVRAASVVNFYAWGESARQNGEAISYTQPQPLLPTMAGNWWALLLRRIAAALFGLGASWRPEDEEKEALWTPDALTAAAHGKRTSSRAN